MRQSRKAPPSLIWNSGPPLLESLPRLRVLVVEDELDFRTVLIRQLHKIHPSIEVDWEVAGERALERMKERANGGDRPYDLVIADVTLTGPLTGLALFWISRKMFKPCPFIVMSGADLGDLLDPEWLDPNAGTALKVLRKPFLAAEFVGVVKSLLESQFPQSARAQRSVQGS